MNIKGSKGLIYGVGINDSGYPTSSRITVSSGNEKKVVRLSKCPFFSVWCDMIRRSCSQAFKDKNPAYADVSVCPEWISFTAFKGWMETQKWQGMDLDKDILAGESKIYSPETCCFVSRATNRFLVHCPESKGTLLGVSWHSPNSKYRAQINVRNKKTFLGYFETKEEAHLAWCLKKKELCIDLIFAEKIPNEIAAALIARFDGFVDRAVAKLNGGSQ